MNRGGAHAEGCHGVFWEAVLVFKNIYGEGGRTYSARWGPKDAQFFGVSWEGHGCHRVSGGEKGGKEQGNEPWGRERRRFVREYVSSTSALYRS